MIKKMTAQRRADIQWSVVRLLGADMFPGRNQANFFQHQKEHLPMLREQWDKLENDEEYKEQVMNQFSNQELSGDAILDNALGGDNV
jgi:hypothetical protein